ncbi:MAG: cytochrome c peroxidase [Elusimicrobiales bacterium]|nr:cytochrome c peroxidase [Elusimicrobiales bacterium]
MKKIVFYCLASAGSLLLLTRGGGLSAGGGFLSNGIRPAVSVPADNPQTDAKIRLGKQLYFDKRLSADNTISCATCHAPGTGWANHGATDTGIKGQVGGRNSGSIIDSAYMKSQFWDGRAATLEAQAVGPIANPIEMGETLENVVLKLNAIPGYKAQFRDVFGTDASADAIGKAIAAFERTIISGPSPYDRYLRGETGAMPASAVRGLAVFNGKGHCSACHSGPSFSDGGFHNLGVGFEKGGFKDEGRYKMTAAAKDLGAFKTPGLRNTAQTYPYLHDGSEKTLEAVIDFYDRGGVPNGNLDRLMVPLHLTVKEKADLLSFLNSLTGPVPEIKEPELPN